MWYQAIYDRPMSLFISFAKEKLSNQKIVKERRTCQMKQKKRKKINTNQMNKQTKEHTVPIRSTCFHIQFTFFNFIV